jgi:hypothetical protein
LATQTVLYSRRPFKIRALTISPPRTTGPIGHRRPRPREHHPAGRADEQRRAFAHLRAVALAHGLRVVADPEGWPHIPGRRGYIEFHDGVRLAAFTVSRLLRSRLLAMPGVVRPQAGDQEMRVLFSPAILPVVAALLRARRHRVGRPLTSERALRLRAGARIGVALATQEPT